jgi:hypothetical protein
MNRRQMLAGMGVTGAVWVVPEITTYRPAAGATLSMPEGRPVAAQGKPLAYTGEDNERDVALGLALITAGWVIKHWAPRTFESRPW